MAAKTIEHPSAGERRARGEQARSRTPVSAHSEWQPTADRPDPVALLEAQNLTREPDLVPVRHGRMMVSPLTFYRGAAKIMDVNRHYYWRQLRDMKGSALVEGMTPLALTFYARICGRTLARAHAGSGDPVAIAEYLGQTDAFDQSITDFSQRYADQNERDYQQFAAAVGSGRLDAREGV